jgi:hypothetical protein
MLARQGRTVTWSLGPAEEDFDLPAGAPILRSGTPVELGRELAGARLYIGNDSGITHLAAAVRCHTFAVFGPTDPAIWAPRGGNVATLRGHPWPSVADVLRVLATLAV